jgi:hypothetical protein
MSWSEPGFGFFGKGFWARRVLWDNIPVQQRTLDTEHRLEQLLEAFGGELEAFLGQIALLPMQRDPYQVRASEGQEEWFYVASSLRWTDTNWGEVLRLIGEPDFAAMPNTGNTLLTFAAGGYVDCVPADLGVSVTGTMSGHGGTLVSYDNATRTWWVRRDTDADLFNVMEGVRVVDGVGHGTLAGAAPLPWPSAYLAAPERYPWYPYEPIGDIARWWRALIPTVDDATGLEDLAEYEVAQARTRNFDQTLLYDPARSLGNEVRVRGGDPVLRFQYPAAWLVLGNAVTDAGALGTGVPIGLADGTQTPPVAFPGPAHRFLPNIGGLAGTPIESRLVVDVPVHGGTPIVRLFDMPDAPLSAETGVLYRLDPMIPWPPTFDLANPMGTVDYLAGTIAIDLDNALGLFTVFDAPITAHWEDRGCYLPFRPPRTIDELARDYGFENDRNDPEYRQRAAIAHLWQYFGCKGAQDAYRIRGEISLFDVVVHALWRICTADLALSLPADHVFVYDGVYYTDLDPRSIRFDDIRADEQYYDTFNHDPLFPSPAWLTLADRALMFEAAVAPPFNDGMSVGLAFGLDVTQGYYGQVSETDVTVRDPAWIVSATALTAAEAAALSLPAGYRVTVEMMRCQAEAFHFSKGHFGLTEYDKAGGVPPAIDDQVYWIDYEESAWNVSAPVPGFPDRDVGRWTIIIGTGVGGIVPAPGAEVAVRYWPEIDHGDCCFCRSYKVRVEIEPMAQAYTYYETEDAMLAAVERLKAKILAQLIPIHARVAEWVVTTEWTIFMGGVRTAWVDTRILDADEWVDMGPSVRILLSIEQRGDLLLPGNTQTMEMTDSAGAPLAPPILTLPAQTGAADPATWYPVNDGVTLWTDVDVTASLNGEISARAIATAAAGVTYGDVRWTFRVTRSTLP